MTWRYLAGFTDGEGCIGVCGRGPRITWGQTNRDVLEAIKAFLEKEGFACNMYTIQPRLPRRPNAVHMLNVNRRKDCERLAKKLRPSLIVKVEACDKLFAWLRAHPVMNNVYDLDEDRVRRLASDGLAIRVIAKKVKCGQSKLRKFCHRHAIPLLNRGCIR